MKNHPKHTKHYCFWGYYNCKMVQMVCYKAWQDLCNFVMSFFFGVKFMAKLIVCQRTEFRFFLLITWNV